MKKRPRDPLGKLIVEFATATHTGDDAGPESSLTKRARAGGKKGGSARAAALSAEERSEIQMDSL